MAQDKAMRVKLILGASKGKPVRFSYLHIHEARLNSESGRMEFSTAVLIPKENVADIAAVKKAIAALIADEWTSKGKPIPPKFWNPLRDGDTDTKQNGDALGKECLGHFVINCKTGEDSPPECIGTTYDAKGDPVKLGKAEIKSGDWGRVSVTLGAYTKGTGGVGAYLGNVQLTRQGDPLGNSRSAKDDFAGFADEDEDDSDMLS